MAPACTNVVWQQGCVDRRSRQGLLQQKGCVVWITGLSGSGKSTVACAHGQAELRAGRRQRAARAVQGPGIFRARPGGEYPARRGGGEAVRRRRSGGRGELHLAVPARPGVGAGAGARGRVRGGVHEGAAGDVRAARLQGAVQAGPGGRDHGVHGHRRLLRGVGDAGGDAGGDGCGGHTGDAGVHGGDGGCTSGAAGAAVWPERLAIQVTNKPGGGSPQSSHSVHNLHRRRCSLHDGKHRLWFSEGIPDGQRFEGFSMTTANVVLEAVTNSSWFIHVEEECREVLEHGRTLALYR